MMWYCIAGVSWAVFLAVVAPLMWFYSRPITTRCAWCRLRTEYNEHRVLDGELLCTRCAGVWAKGEQPHLEDMEP